MLKRILVPTDGSADSAAGLETGTRVEVGWPQAVIEQAAREADLVILCTHGRGGLERLRHGSVAEHVVREVDRPASPGGPSRLAHDPTVESSEFQVQSSNCPIVEL